MLYNRFLQIRFLDRNKVVGGRHELVGVDIVCPPSISIKITHRTESNPNTAEVRIWNLSPESQRELLHEKDRIVIEAGYWPHEGERITGPIFSGTIREATTDHSDGINTIAVLKCGDGDLGYANARIFKEYTTPPTHKQIVEDLLFEFKLKGIERGIVEIPDFTESKEYSIDNRLVRNELDDIAHQHDLIWQIIDGEINIYPRTNVIENTGYVVTPTTGLIGSPHFNEDGAKIQTAMLPDFRPGWKFNIATPSRRITETCIVDEVVFSGSNFGRRFGADVEAKFVEQGKVQRSIEQGIGLKT